jgi:F-box protein 21
MLPELPLDVLVHILGYLPPDRSKRDQSVSALVACLRTTSIVREAATVPAVWKSHYQTRYEHCDEERERTRRETFGSESPNWRLLYATRRRIDKVAIEHLDNLLQNRRVLRRTGECILDLSMDVWDALDIESQFSDAEEIIPQHSLTRSFWATALLKTLTRSCALLVWRKFWLESLPDPTFEDTMNVLSGFFGYSNERVRYSGIECLKYH